MAELDHLVCGPGFSALGEGSLGVVQGAMTYFDAKTVFEMISKRRKKKSGSQAEVIAQKAEEPQPVASTGLMLKVPEGNQLRELEDQGLHVTPVGVGSSEEDESELALHPRKRRQGQEAGPSVQPHFRLEEWLSPAGSPISEVPQPPEDDAVGEQSELPEKESAEDVEIASRLNKGSVFSVDLKKYDKLSFGELVEQAHRDLALSIATHVKLLSRAEELSRCLEKEMNYRIHFAKLAKERARRIAELEVEMEKMKNNEADARAILATSFRVNEALQSEVAEMEQPLKGAEVENQNLMAENQTLRTENQSLTADLKETNNRTTVSMQDIMECFQRDTGCHVQAGRPINQHKLQRQQSQSDHPLTDENMQYLEAQSDENLQHSTKVLGIPKSDKRRIVDSYTDEELHVCEQLLKQSMISLLHRQNIVASSSGSRGIEEFQFMAVERGSMGVESSSGPQRRNEIESPTREAQGMDVDTELRLGFSHWRA